MRALLDVNVLIAIVDPNHQHHLIAAAWFAHHAPRHGWASCPLTQNGVVRIIGNKGYPNPQPVAATVVRLQAMCAHASHQFWPDDVSLLDAATFNHGKLLKSDNLTDVYLLALAARHEACFVTLDGSVATNAVVGFRSAHQLRLIA